MAKHAANHFACFAIFICVLTSGCATRGPLLAGTATELRATPFYPQTRYHCGPAALATVLAASGVNVTPDQLTPRVYVPARRGSLQVEMQAAPRDFGRLALVLPRHLEAIVKELQAGRPVLVLHNQGWWLWPRWHYAVVVGYDPGKDTFTLRSGRKPRQQMRTRHFMVYWHHAARWAMVVLRPGETAATDDPALFLETAAEFERVASPADSLAAFDAAVRRWPREPVAWIGRGTAHYRAGQYPAAASDYAAALELDANQAGARNNLAQVLLELRCPHRAAAELARIDMESLPSTLRDAVAATMRDAASAVRENPVDAEMCASLR
jgi:tetratricopeptide (TPR) repeat protein